MLYNSNELLTQTSKWVRYFKLILDVIFRIIIECYSYSWQTNRYIYYFDFLIILPHNYEIMYTEQLTETSKWVIQTNIWYNIQNNDKIQLLCDQMWENRASVANLIIEFISYLNKALN